MTLKLKKLFSQQLYIHKRLWRYHQRTVWRE